MKQQTRYKKDGRRMEEEEEKGNTHVSSSSSSDPKFILLLLYIFKIVLLSLKLPNSIQFRSVRSGSVQFDPILHPSRSAHDRKASVDGGHARHAHIKHRSARRSSEPRSSLSWTFRVQGKNVTIIAIRTRIDQLIVRNSRPTHV